MARQRIARSSDALPRRYRWHHYVVSLLCVMALAAVVSSLFTTINSIHNVKKKKRDLSRRSVVDGAGNGTSSVIDSGNNDLTSSMMDNVMEINHSIATTPGDDHKNNQDNSSSLAKNSEDLMTGSDARNNVPTLTEDKGSSINANNTSSSSKIENDQENESGGDDESDFESGDSTYIGSDDTGESGNDQVDSVESNTAAPTSMNVTEPTDVNATNSAANVISTGSGDDGDDVDGDDSDDGEVDVTFNSSTKETPPPASLDQENPQGNNSTKTIQTASTATMQQKDHHENNSTKTIQSSEDESDNDEGGDDVDEKDLSPNNTSTNINKGSASSASMQPRPSSQKVWYLPTTSTPSLTTNVSTTTKTPAVQQQHHHLIKANNTISSTPSINNTSKAVKAVQTKTPVYKVVTYGVIGNPSQKPVATAPKTNQSVTSHQSKHTRKEARKQQQLTQNNTENKITRKKVQLAPTKHLVPSHVSNMTAKNVSSSLYSSNTAGDTTKKDKNTKNIPSYSRNIDENHKDGDGSSTTDHPTFPKNYHSSGIIILPNSKIAEPFEIWYAPEYQRSRIDYYYGNDKTYQLGDVGAYGVSHKYVPMFNDKEKNFDGCYSLTGTKNRRVVAQVITPNMTWFKYNKTEVYTGVMTTKWTYQYTAFGMKNFQSVWVTKNKPYRPIRYEMYGFDMMLGSYYDDYVINYVSFEEWTPDSATFQLPANMQCFNWSNSLESSLAVNPMQEFTAFSPENAVDHHARYVEFKNKHYQDKPHPGDTDKRKHVFKHNARFINSHNRKNLSYKLKANMFSDKFDEELKHFHGGLEKDKKQHEGIKEFHKLGAETTSHPIDKDIPEEIDWRNYGAVSPVGGQGICGACYAFSAAEAVEGAWYRKTSKMVRLSKQQLVDCSWGFGNHGCKGGHYAGALSWVFVHGISTAKSYGKYLGQEGYCHFNDTWFGANIEGFAYVPIWNATALKRTVAMHGPVAISINTIPLSFKFYSKGIYNDPKCEKNRTTHSALVVGYGKENDQEYWIVKNSWSSLWGERGYIRVAMKDDLCGVTEYPVAVIVKHPSFHLPKTKPVVDDGSDILDGKDVEKLPAAGDGANIPVNPSGTKDVPHNVPGGIDLNDNNKKKKESPNEDEQDDEDEQVDKQNKQIVSHLQQVKQQQQQQQMILKHQRHQGVFEDSLNTVSVPVKGLHIEDINNDIKKIHMLLVNTAEEKKGDKKQNEQVKAFGKTSESPPTTYDSSVRSVQPTRKKTAKKQQANKAQVASPARPVQTTTTNTIQVVNNNNNKVSTASQKGKKNKPKKQKQKKESHKNMKEELKELIKKLDYAELTSIAKQNKERNAAKKTNIQAASKKNPASLNPATIGSLSHNNNKKRSKTTKHDGTKKSTISRINHTTHRKQQTTSKRRKSKVERTNKRSKEHSQVMAVHPGPGSETASSSLIRKTMDLQFLGMPTATVNKINNKRKTISRRATPKSHKQNKITSKKPETAIETAKENSLDSIYSLIDRKVHDYTSHTNKKRDMNYYKHHIKN